MPDEEPVNVEINVEEILTNLLMGDDENQGVLVDWMLVGKFSHLDSTDLAITCSRSMDLVTLLGLAEYGKICALRRLDGEYDDQLESEDEGE